MKRFIILFALIMFSVLVSQAQISKSAQVTIFSTGATVTQDSLDVKLNRAEFWVIMAGDTVYARGLFARDTTYRKAQETAIRAVIAADSNYRAAQETAIRAIQAADSTYKSAQIALKMSTSAFKADTGSFSTAAVRAALYEPGALNASYWVATIRNQSEVLPVAGDLLSVYVKKDSVIVNRVAGTTSGLKFTIWGKY
jgi:hypothetical protein